MQGIITLFINRNDFKDQSTEQSLINMFKELNKSLIESCITAGYQIMFVTTTDEASRLEKIDFDKPYTNINVVNSTSEIVEGILKYQDAKEELRKLKEKENVS